MPKNLTLDHFKNISRIKSKMKQKYLLPVQIDEREVKFLHNFFICDCYKCEPEPQISSVSYGLHKNYVMKCS